MRHHSWCLDIQYILDRSPPKVPATTTTSCWPLLTEYDFTCQRKAGGLLLQSTFSYDASDEQEGC